MLSHHHHHTSNDIMSQTLHILGSGCSRWARTAGSDIQGRKAGSGEIKRWNWVQDNHNAVENDVVG